MLVIAWFIAAGAPAAGAAEAPCGAIDERLVLDTGAFIRAKEALSANGGGTISFAVGKSSVGRGARAGLDKVIAWLMAHPEGKVTLQGHADEPGADEYNLALGDKRANSVQAYMVAHGIEPSRLSTVTFGRSRPHLRGDAGAHRNGRVELVLGIEGCR
jgi:peptidoglycan-associated lipoprotein